MKIVDEGNEPCDLCNTEKAKRLPISCQVYLLRTRAEVGTKLSRFMVELGKPRKIVAGNAEEFKFGTFSDIYSEEFIQPDYVPLTTTLGLKYKRRMLYFPMDFGELTVHGLVDTGALSSAIPEADLRKVQLLAIQSIVRSPIFKYW